MKNAVVLRWRLARLQSCIIKAENFLSLFFFIYSMIVLPVDNWLVTLCVSFFAEETPAGFRNPRRTSRGKSLHERSGGGGGPDCRYKFGIRSGWNDQPGREGPRRIFLKNLCRFPSISRLWVNPLVTAFRWWSAPEGNHSENAAESLPETNRKRRWRAFERVRRTAVGGFRA